MTERASRHADSLDEGAPVIRVEGAAVALGGRTIWSDVSLEVAAGEFWRFWGRMGRGSRRC